MQKPFRAIERNQKFKIGDYTFIRGEGNHYLDPESREPVGSLGDATLVTMIVESPDKIVDLLLEIKRLLPQYDAMGDDDKKAFRHRLYQRTGAIGHAAVDHFFPACRKG